MADTCDVCEQDLDEADSEDGLCPECFGLSGGAKYCCGAIYEDGEDARAGAVARVCNACFVVAN